MNRLPVGRVTRRQQALRDQELKEEKKRRWLAAKSNWRKRLRRVSNNERKEEEDDDDEIEIVDESAYLQRIAALKANSAEQNSSVEENQDNGRLDEEQNDHNVVDNVEGNVVAKNDGNGDVAENDGNGDVAEINSNGDVAEMDSNVPSGDVAEDARNGDVVESDENGDVVEDDRNGDVADDDRNGDVAEDDRNGDVADDRNGDVAEDDRNGDVADDDRNGDVAEDDRNGDVADDDRNGDVAEDDRNGDVADDRNGDVAEDDRNGDVADDDRNGDVAEDDRNGDVADDRNGDVADDDRNGDVADDDRNGDVAEDDRNGDVADDDRNGDVVENYPKGEAAINDRNGDDSDDSLQIIGERWNSDNCYDSHSSGMSSDSDDETTSAPRKGESEGGGHKRKTVGATGLESPDIRSSLSAEEVNEKSGGDCDASMSDSKDGCRERDNEGVSDAVLSRKKFDGLVLRYLPAIPEDNSESDDFVGRRARSHSHRRLVSLRRKFRDGTFTRPVNVDESTSSSSQELVDGHGCQNNRTAKDVKRNKGRPLISACVDAESETETEDDLSSGNGSDCVIESETEKDPGPVKDSGPVNVKESEDNGKRKRGRPPKNRNVESGYRKKRAKKRKTNDAEDILLNTILENENANVETLFCSQREDHLPLKFSFGGQNSVPKNSGEELEIENLFDELEFGLRTFDIGCRIYGSDEEDDDGVLSCDGAIVQEKMCQEGKHYFIQDEEIGIRCKYCFFVKLEIRNVTPGFHKNPFGKSENKSYFWPPYNDQVVPDGSFLPEDSNDPHHAHCNNLHGTVWDLVPGVKKSLFAHQQEAFEFIWRNVRGGIKLDEVGDELGVPGKRGLGGCLVCHEPGTGKTRLAITFLQSFIRKYPNSKPVIIAPKSMLLTWGEEFAKWNVDVPFLNMNKDELSGKEELGILKHAENVKSVKMIRLAKLCTWSMGKGILGISYRLFEELAGDKKEMDEKIKQTLLKQPCIMFLDEGHTPRNNDSNIWNVLTKVETRSKIILSGTPFQNNFEELRNILSLVREEFRNPLLLGSCENRGSKHSNGDNDGDIIMALRKRMKPFVHVYKRGINESLPGCFHSVVLLNPSDLQKDCCHKLKTIKHMIELSHLVSLVCLHPSLLIAVHQLPHTIDKSLLEKQKSDIDAGLKIRFVFDLINLAVGERILVFNQYLQPLEFIAELFKSHYHWDEGKEFLYMHGKQDSKHRQSLISLFNDPSNEVRVMLASTKACCEGINLVGASRVVLLDVVWNPSVERQAISRAHRYGQQRDVFVYHLITSGTLEQEKYYRQVNKDRLSKLVFAGGESKQNTSSLLEDSKDRILNAMVQNEKSSKMFSEIFKADI